VAVLAAVLALVVIVIISIIILIAVWRKVRLHKNTVNNVKTTMQNAVQLLTHSWDPNVPE
jgi:uncharacterized membrane protein